MSTIDRPVDARHVTGLDALADPAVYDHYRRLFASALARLARGGFAAPPDEGLDLIHGFFADLWNNAALRHDPQRAKFDTYIFTCFVNYARPRIVRLRRARRLLAEPSLIERALAAVSAPDEHEIESLDLATIRQAIAGLPARAQAILLAYLGEEFPSERDLAVKFGLTRYQVRMQLSDAIGETMVALSELSVIAPADRPIALSLFRDRRTIDETAKFLQRSAADVRNARAQWLGFLIQAAKGKRNMESMRHAPPPTDASVGALAADLLVAALRPEAGAGADAAIRDHREAIWRFLEDPAAERLLKPYAETDPARLARVYSLLADDEDDAPALADGEYYAFLSARENEERLIGEGFQVLMAGLDGDVSRPWKYFSGLPEADVDTQERLREAPSVLAGGSPALDLVRYGITPVTITEASVSVARLAFRFCREHAVEVGGRIDLEGPSSQRSGDDHVTLPRHHAIENLARSIELSPSVTERIYDWLWEVASFAPLLFEDFEACALQDRLILKRIDETELDLSKRWNLSHEAAASSRRYA